MMILQKLFCRQIRIIISIFFINILLTFFYIKFINLNFDYNLVERNFCSTDFLICYLPDIHYYIEILQEINGPYRSPESIKKWIDGIFKINGGTSLHTIFFYFSSSSNIISHSVILNSFFVSIFFFPLLNKIKVSLLILLYLILSPFFVFFSIGPTKEIFLLAGSSLFFHGNHLIGSFFVFISRSYYIAFLLFIKIINFFKYKYTIIFGLLIFLSILIPFLSFFISDFKILTKEVSNFTHVIDNLRYELPILSLLGFLSTLLKNILEPIVYLYKHGLNFFVNNFLVLIYFYFLLIAFISGIYIIVKKKYKHIINSDEFKYLLITLVVLGFYPIVQFRYILVPLILLLVNVYVDICNEKIRKY